MKRISRWEIFGFGLLLAASACSDDSAESPAVEDSAESPTVEDSAETATDSAAPLDSETATDTDDSPAVEDSASPLDSETASDSTDSSESCGLLLVPMRPDGEVDDFCGLSGSWYWYSDDQGTAVSGAEQGRPPFVPDASMCLKGDTLADPTFAAWGAGIGLSTREAEEAKAPWNASARNIIGFEVRLEGGTSFADLRMLLESTADRAPGVSPPFVTLSGPGRYRVLFEDFQVPGDWTPNGGETADPTAIEYVSFHVAGGETAAAFDFCVAELSPITVDMIDDLEDGDEQILVQSGRSGAWYTYGDGTGVQSSAPVVAPFETSGGGAFAVTSGDGFTSFGAGMGFHLSEAVLPETYDASRYAGLSFRIRGESATGSVRVIPFISAVSDPLYGGTCDEACDAVHFFEVKVDDAWRRFALPFETLFELGQTGVPFDASTLLGVNFQAPEGGPFEIAVDDIAFYRCAVSKPNPDPKIEIDLGARRDLLLPHDHGLSSFPDQPVVALDVETTTRYFITAWPDEGTSYPSAGAKMPTFALDAANLDEWSTATVKEVLTPGEAGAFDNGYSGLAGLYRHSDGGLYGFYHAEDWEETGLLPDTGDVEVAAFYAMVGEAVSYDDGLTWTKLGPVIRSNTQKEWLAYPEHMDRGVCGPSAVTDTTGRYLYLYYTDNSRQNDRGVQISLARADLSKGPPVPGAFQKYYLGDFTEPGLGGLESPLPGEGRRSYYPNLGYGHVVYSAYLKRYVMVQNVDYWREHHGDPPLPLEESGLGISFSEDGIFWSAPRVVITDYVAFSSGRSFSYMGQILFDDETGRTGTLVYGHSDNWGIGAGEAMHHPVGHPVRFSL